jgi:GT2 family glycosyltransferase
VTAARDVLMIVPTRGERDALLDISLQSLAAQTVPPRIVVITGSDPEDIIERWGGLPGLSVIRERGRGLSEAINQAWHEDGWSSEFTSWLGDDDALPPWSIEEAVAVLDARPRAVAVHGPCAVIDDAGKPVGVYRNGWWASLLAGYGINLIAQPGALFRTSAVREVGGLDPSLRLAMDVDLFVRLRKQGAITQTRRQLGVFREHPDSLSTSQATAARRESRASITRAHRRRADRFLDLVALPVCRSVGRINQHRPAAHQSYWRPASP